ncbi:MAG TPA: hypothetical protein VFV95_13115 [Vicinamibacterales bacterium]|nr:hypothetical protein [Vicinamibacterales bacterium]
MTDQNAINEQEWSNPENWTGWWCIYRSQRDTRIWVPKRNPRMGLTLNFAHRGAYWSLLGLSIVPLSFILLFLLVKFAR